MQFLRSIKKTSALTLILGLFGLILVGASILPDPCLGDDDCCCTCAQAHDCGSLCCMGIEARTVDPIVLEPLAIWAPAPVEPLHQPEPFIVEPLIRPPILG